MIFLMLSTIIAWVLCVGCFLGVVKTRGLLRQLQGIVIAVGFGAVAVLLSSLLAVLRACEAFSGETLVARVSARWVGPDEFELTYLPAGRPSMEARRARLHGDQWAVSGGVVKWQSWLTVLGWPSYHKPMRLEGRFAQAERMQTYLPSVALLAPEPDRLWVWWFRYGSRLPFVETVYGSAAYVFVEPQRLAEIYVTPSGYLIKRRPRASGKTQGER